MEGVVDGEGVAKEGRRTGVRGVRDGHWGAGAAMGVEKAEGASGWCLRILISSRRRSVQALDRCSDVSGQGGRGGQVRLCVEEGGGGRRAERTGPRRLGCRGGRGERGDSI